MSLLLNYINVVFTVILILFYFLHHNYSYNFEQAISTDNFAVQSDQGRSYIELICHDYGYKVVDEIADLKIFIISPDLHPSAKRFSDEEIIKIFNSYPHVSSIIRIYYRFRATTLMRPSDFKFNDPFFQYQWYLVNNGKLFREPKRQRADLNILPAWIAGLNGTGVKTVVIDDGLEITNEDLAGNYDRNLSKNLVENKEEPMPVNPLSYGHGTMCASMIAAVPNNHWCGVGGAFGSKVGGVRLLGRTDPGQDEGVSKVLDSDEIVALLWASNITDFYSMSWGPVDDGKTMSGPGPLSEHALMFGARSKQNTYVVSAGNGGIYGDHCGSNGYIQSEHTIGINSVNAMGGRANYGEQCAAIAASVYVSAQPVANDDTLNAIYDDELLIAMAIFESSNGGVASGVNHKCVMNFTGTSAAVPLAVSCFTFSKQVNPTLNFRDYLHLLARSARIPIRVLPGENDWYYNGAGFHVSHYHGFGVVDAAAMAALAIKWPGSPPQGRCTMFKSKLNKKLNAGATVIVELDTSSNAATESGDCTFDSLEYVIVYVNLSYPVRGHVALYLKSPSDMEATLLGMRPHDEYENITFKFKSIQQWGENPLGIIFVRM